MASLKLASNKAAGLVPYGAQPPVQALPVPSTMLRRLSLPQASTRPGANGRIGPICGKFLPGSRKPRQSPCPRPSQQVLQAAMDVNPSSFKPESHRLSGLSQEEVSAYMRMARLHNTLPALLLVFVGAWAGTGRNPAVLSNMTVWLMAFISAGVSAASMVINDYFDWVSGTDNINAPDKPLPSGQAKPDIAVLLAGSMYVAVLIGACMMENPAIRAIVAFSAGATLLYTPVFKRVTMVKNALVASVIALAPLSGALAAGASLAMLQRLAVPSLFAFTAITYREVLMDCADEAGDREAGVRTLPVMLGPGPALLLASMFMTVGGAVGVGSLLASSLALITPPASPSLLAYITALAPAWPNLACAAVVALIIIRLVTLVVSVFRSGFHMDAINHAVGACIKPMGLGIIMLAAMV